MKANTCLIGLDTGERDLLWTPQESIDELAELARTAGLNPIEKIIQKTKPFARFYIGKGKTEEVSELVIEKKIEVLIADDELSPMQLRNLEKKLNIKIMDRTSLILDIFAKRALTAEAQLQVELAQLNYTLPRLTRMWTHLSRLGGGIGTKGPGEKQLEVDKRQIRKRVTYLKKKIKLISKQRELRRQKRLQEPTLTCAIVGYTNAGKSTLMNVITHSSVLAEDKLFATLDPTTRQLTLPNNEHIVLTDTVGFIQKLPHHLIEAFKSTLEVLQYADLLVHVIDASHPNAIGMIQTAQNIIKDLGADHIPQLFVFNKMDLVSKPNLIKETLKEYEPHVFISIIKEKDSENFVHTIEKQLTQFQKEFLYKIPYTRMDVYHLLHQHGHILSQEYKEDYMELKVKINTIKGEKIMGSLYPE